MTKVIALVYDYGTAYLIDGDVLREEEFLFYRSNFLLVGVIKGGRERIAAQIQWERRKSVSPLDEDGVEYNSVSAGFGKQETEDKERSPKPSKKRSNG
jgi:hypothetical protein